METMRGFSRMQERRVSCVNEEKEELLEQFGKISPVITRCFYTKKSAMPEAYHERISRCYELEYIPWGEGWVMTDGEKLPAVSGTVFFRRPKMKIHGFLPYSSYGILMDDIPVTDLPLSCSFSVSHTIGFLFQDVYRNYLSDDPLGQLKMKADVLNIIYHMLDYQRSEEKRRGTISIQYHLERLKHLTEYIETNLAEHMTLDEMAAICSISPSFLCRLFKQAYNETIFSYLNRRRVQRAKSLLIETNKPIKDICTSCGFSNESYFYRTFKRTAQISPTDFRKLHRQPFGDMPDPDQEE